MATKSKEPDGAPTPEKVEATIVDDQAPPTETPTVTIPRRSDEGTPGNHEFQFRPGEAGLIEPPTRPAKADEYPPPDEAAPMLAAVPPPPPDPNPEPTPKTKAAAAIQAAAAVKET